MEADVESLTALVEQTQAETRRFLAIVSGVSSPEPVPALNLAA